MKGGSEPALQPLASQQPSERPRCPEQTLRQRGQVAGIDAVQGNHRQPHSCPECRDKLWTLCPPRCERGGDWPILVWTPPHTADAREQPPAEASLQKTPAGNFLHMGSRAERLLKWKGARNSKVVSLQPRQTSSCPSHCRLLSDVPGRVHLFRT